MGDIENFNEIVDDLRDEVHDLQHDLRSSEKEVARLENELQGMIEEQDLDESAHNKQMTVMADEIRNLTDENRRQLASIADFRVQRVESENDYIKALSIAGTVAENGSTDYFHTKQGKELMAWVKKELERLYRGIKNGK